jgi:hypothetical protein
MSRRKGRLSQWLAGQWRCPPHGRTHTAAGVTAWSGRRGLPRSRQRPGAGKPQERPAVRSARLDPQVAQQPVERLLVGVVLLPVGEVAASASQDRLAY